jgi:small neutral amino acid transporter SnatA (MarC family)
LPFLPLYAFTYLWMKADARERARQCPPGATPLIVGFYAIAVLYHLIATRPGLRKATAVLGFLGFVVLVLIVHSLATYIGSLL